MAISPVTQDPSQPEPSGPVAWSSSRGRGRGRFIRDVVVIAVLAIALSVVLKNYVVRSFYIPSASMSDTLKIDDRILVNELVPRFIDLERGDVVVFDDPGGWLRPIGSTTPAPTTPGTLPEALRWALTQTGLSADDTDDHLVKRVIGVAGDTVVCCDAEGRTSVNGTVLDEPYLRVPPDAVTFIPFSVTVPAGTVWVEGDNRANSEDSRLHQGLPSGGFVPVSDIVGRAVVISWPIDRWTFLDNHSTVFDAAR